MRRTDIVVCLAFILAICLSFPYAVAAPPPPPPASTVRGRALVFNTAATGGADILSTAISPKFRTRWLITVVVKPSETASVFGYTVTNSGVTLAPINFEAGAALQAGQVYTYEIDVEPAYTYNFRFVTTTVVGQLIVHEELTGSK